jgi:hypothetical protein
MILRFFKLFRNFTGGDRFCPAFVRTFFGAMVIGSILLFSRTVFGSDQFFVRTTFDWYGQAVTNCHGYIPNFNINCTMQKHSTLVVCCEIKETLYLFFTLLF